MHYERYEDPYLPTVLHSWSARSALLRLTEWRDNVRGTDRRATQHVSKTVAILVQTKIPHATRAVPPIHKSTPTAWYSDYPPSRHHYGGPIFRINHTLQVFMIIVKDTHYKQEAMYILLYFYCCKWYNPCGQCYRRFGDTCRLRYQGRRVLVHRLRTLQFCFERNRRRWNRIGSVQTRHQSPF